MNPQARSLSAFVSALLAVIGMSFAGCGNSIGSSQPSAAEDHSGAGPQARSGVPAGSKPAAGPAAKKHKPAAGPIVLKPKAVSDVVADFTFTERSGKKVGRKDLLGRPWVACFIFTHCAGPCSDVSGQMSGLQEWLKTENIDDVRLVTFSVDPRRDTPEVLRRYAKNFGADEDRWWFLTGDQDAIYKLIRDSFDQPVRQQTGADRQPGWEVFHSTAVMLVDEKGRVVEEFNGKYEVSMLQLRNRIRNWTRTGTFRKPKPQRSTKDGS